MDGVVEKQGKALFNVILKKIVFAILSSTTAIVILIISFAFIVIAILTDEQAKQEQQTAASIVSFSDNVEAYRDTINGYAITYNVEQYTNVLLSIMEIETGGNGTDVMNSAPFECNVYYGKNKGDILDPYYSCYCGVRQFSLIKLTIGKENLSDDDLKIIISAYHYGVEFISFAQSHGGYSLDTIIAYSAAYGGVYNSDLNFTESVWNLYTLNSMPDQSTLFFKYPLTDYHSVSSGYGYRKNPVTGKPELHGGTDFPAPIGTNIYASADGQVIEAGFNASYGNYVLIQHNSQYKTRYAHCNSLAVTVGDYVKQGQLIAFVGKTGNVTGAHVHFEIIQNGVRVDAMPYLEMQTEVLIQE